MLLSPAPKQIVAVRTLEDASAFGYSQCVKVVSLEFEPQARAALERVRAAVEAAGGTLSDIVAMTVFITDTRFGRVFTSLRREYFGQDFPTSAVIGVSTLMVPQAMIEVQATAILTGA